MEMNEKKMGERQSKAGKSEWRGFCFLASSSDLIIIILIGSVCCSSYLISSSDRRLLWLLSHLSARHSPPSCQANTKSKMVDLVVDLRVGLTSRHNHMPMQRPVFTSTAA